MIKPSEVARASWLRREENRRFADYIRSSRVSPRRLDDWFRWLYRVYSAKIDCGICRNCCQRLWMFMREEDIRDMAYYLVMDERKFKNTYLVKSLCGYELPAPCPFLGEEGVCTVEDCRPLSCREFPFAERPGRARDILAILDHARVCPIVYEILERLKVETGFLPQSAEDGEKVKLDTTDT